MLEIVDPGALATIQDRGRPDATALGVPRAGACDPRALAVANLLLGDDAGAPVIEFAGGLPSLHVREDTVIAVAGADLGFRMDAHGPWVRPGTSVMARAGTLISATRPPPWGVRACLALPGGVDVPRVLGSASTAIVGGFGGHLGRPLRQGDLVHAGDRGRLVGAGHAWPGPAPASGVVAAHGPIALAVTDGPHRDLIPHPVEALLGATWRVADEADRVGVRLAPADGPAGSAAAHEASGSATADGPAGSAAAHERSLESFGLAWGAIEVPPDGRPIVLLPDGPTVGGYPVPLVVAGVDLPRLGQLRPGDLVRFRHLSAASARAELLAADEALERSRAALAVMRSVW